MSIGSFVFGLTLLSGALGQSITSNGCLQLLGSAACPGFSAAYVNPANLSNAFPFFANVTDVKSFDAGAFGYFANQYQFEQTKFTRQLGCSNASQAVIRWERTVLCSMWVNEQWSAQCLAFYNGSSAATSQKMVCQQTCLEYSSDENAVVNNPAYCPGSDTTGGARLNQLLKDFEDCTSWTTLATNNSATCVLGSTNEGNCGWGSSTTQLCGHCSSSTPDSCCYSTTYDIPTVCGYTLPAIVSNSPSSTSGASSSSMPTSSGSLQNDNSSSGSRLSGGALAGTIVGSILGGLLLLALIILLLLCLRRKKDKRQSTSSSFAAQHPTSRPTTGFFSSIIPSNRNSAASVPPNEKGGAVLGSGHYPNASSPTMGGDTLYSVGGGNKSSLSGGMIGAGAGAGLGALAAKGASGGGGGGRSGVVLPRVKDENQGGDRWIETGAEVSVLWPYQAALPDELDLRPGMKLRVLRLYDDAWGTAQVLSGGEAGEVGKQGAFPIVCVSEGSTLGSSSPGSAES